MKRKTVFVTAPALFLLAFGSVILANANEQSSARQQAQQRAEQGLREQRQWLAELEQRQWQIELAEMFNRAGNNTGGLGGSVWRRTIRAGAIGRTTTFTFNLDGTFTTSHYIPSRRGTFRVYGNSIIFRFDAGSHDVRHDWGYDILLWDGYYGAAGVLGDSFMYGGFPEYVRTISRW